MAEPSAPLLELGQGSVEVILRRNEFSAFLHELAHMLGVRRPVSSHAQHAAVMQHARDTVNECRPHQPSLVMALFMPGVRKEQMHALET